MNILISGSHGLIGAALLPHLTSRGDRVIRLVRPGAPAAPDEIEWDPVRGELDPRRLEGIDAVIHLAGEPIAGGRWTPSRKARIRESRVEGTRFLASTIAGIAHGPRALLCASAIGYYGDRGDELLTEESAPGHGFLADVTREWEEAAAPAEQAGIRVAYLRSGIVLSSGGGALAQFLPLFRRGLGGRLGSGRQYMSWIDLDDEVGAIAHIVDHEALRGPVNLVSPGPVTNQDFTRTLGRILRRPTLLAVPGGALRMALGDMAEEVLKSARVHPTRLVASGYPFRFRELEGALSHLLGNGRRFS